MGRKTLLGLQPYYFFGEEGGGQSDLENCAYLWKNPGYDPALSHDIYSVREKIIS